MCNEWRDIETVPKDGTVILIAGEGRVSAGRYWEDRGRTLTAEDEPYWQEYDNSYWERYETDDSWFQPTHWMPLPPPPEPQGDEG